MNDIPTQRHDLPSQRQQWHPVLLPVGVPMAALWLALSGTAAAVYVPCRWLLDRALPWGNTP